MIVIYLSLLAALLLVNRYFFGSLIKPNDVFNCIWCVFGGLTSMGVLGFYKTSLTVNLMVIVTILSFNLAYICVYCIRNRHRSLNKGECCRWNGYSPLTLENTNVNIKLILALNVFSWIFSLPYLARSLKILFTEGFVAIRMYTYTYGEEAAIASTNAQLFFTWIVQPVFAATMTVCAASIVLSLKHRILLLGVSMADVVVYTLLFGGRGTVLKLVSFLVIGVIVVSGKKLIGFVSKHKGIICLLLFLLAVILKLITARSFVGMSIIKNIYAYVAGPFVFLDAVLEGNPVGDTVLWGSATVGCITSVLGAVGKLLLGIDFTAPENSIPGITAAYLYIGENVKFNSMTTMIYPFLLDFGYPGVVIGPFIFGAFVALIEKNFRKELSLRSLCLFIYVFHTVVFSVQNYTYFKLEALSIIVFILIFTTGMKISGGKIKLW